MSSGYGRAKDKAGGQWMLIQQSYITLLLHFLNSKVQFIFLVNDKTGRKGASKTGYSRWRKPGKRT